MVGLPRHPALEPGRSPGGAWNGYGVLQAKYRRTERGTGLAYFRTRPDPATVITTAAGDLGSPLQDPGGGWWWIA